MVVRKLSKIIRFAHDLTLFSSFLQSIILINISSTLAASVGFTPFGIAQASLTMHFFHFPSGVIVDSLSSKLLIREKSKE